jgi:hypothetical protein
VDSIAQAVSTTAEKPFRKLLPLVEDLESRLGGAVTQVDAHSRVARP